MAQRHAGDPGKAGLPVGTIDHLRATREGSPTLALSFRCQIFFCGTLGCHCSVRTIVCEPIAGERPGRC